MSIALDPAKTGLLLVDYQNGFLSPQGRLAQEGENVELMRAIIEPTKRLLEDCQKAGIVDFWSIQEHYAEDKAREKHKVTPHLKKRKAPPCLHGTWETKIIDELQGYLSDSSQVFVKNKWSCFFNTNLEFLLRRLDIDTLLVCGVSTCICVETTVRDAYMRDYDVILMEDCTSHYDPEAHRATLKFINRFAGMTATVEDVRRMLARQPQEVLAPASSARC